MLRNAALGLQGLTSPPTQFSGRQVLRFLEMLHKRMCTSPSRRLSSVLKVCD